MNAFFKTLLHVAIGGAAAGAAQVYTTTGTPSFKTLGAVALASAATSLLSLFTQKPAPTPPTV